MSIESPPWARTCPCSCPPWPGRGGRGTRAPCSELSYPRRQILFCDIGDPLHVTFIVRDNPFVTFAQRWGEVGVGPKATTTVNVNKRGCVNMTKVLIKVPLSKTKL